MLRFVDEVGEPADLSEEVLERRGHRVDDEAVDAAASIRIDLPSDGASATADGCHHRLLARIATDLRPGAQRNLEAVWRT